MNFFEAQAKARRSTTLLVVLFLLGVAGTVALTHLLLLVVWAQFNGGTTELSVASLMRHNDAQSVTVSAAVVLFIVVSGGLYKLFQLSAGGRVVADALEGKLIPRESSDEAERRLLNVVDEMALASGVASPPVYLLESDSINAFAAGLTYDDAVIGITRGALNGLERQELQGVIAHEFSHIFNGDMRLNSRITGVLHGILLIGLIGRQILRALDDSGVHRRRSSNNKKGDAVGAAIMIGIGFTVIGFVGTLFGEIIKATISRQREYLADASAVQYTRYPAGIANALKKIGSVGSEIRSNEASAYSHFYFADGVKGFWDHLFSTHPDLKKRIRRIEPRWDGKFLTVVPESATNDIVEYATEKPKKEVFTAVSTAAVLGAIDRMGEADAPSVEKAREILQELPKALLGMARHPMGAQAVVLALLGAGEAQVRDLQLGFLRQQPLLLNQIALAQPYVDALEKGLRLPLLLQCIVSLKMMSSSQYKEFRSAVKRFTEADGKLSLFEWTLEHLLLHPLDLQFGIVKEPVQIHTHIGAVRKEIEVYLSELARTQYDDEAAARRAFDETVRAAGATALRYAPRSVPGYEAFDEAVHVLEKGRLGVRKKVLDMSVELLSHDGQIDGGDLELLHAMASTLKLPIPQVA